MGKAMGSLLFSLQFAPSCLNFLTECEGHKILAPEKGFVI